MERRREITKKVWSTFNLPSPLQSIPSSFKWFCTNSLDQVFSFFFVLSTLRHNIVISLISPLFSFPLRSQQILTLPIRFLLNFSVVRRESKLQRRRFVYYSNQNEKSRNQQKKWRTIKQKNCNEWESSFDPYTLPQFRSSYHALSV